MAFFGSLFKRSKMENRILGVVLMLTGFALKRLLDPVIHGKNDQAYIARTVLTIRISVVCRFQVYRFSQQQKRFNSITIKAEVCCRGLFCEASALVTI